MRLLLTVALAWLGLGGAALAAGDRAFSDWHVTCDNTGACTALGFDAAEGDSAHGWIRIDRGPEAGAAPVVSVSMWTPVNMPPRNGMSLALDGHGIAGLPARVPVTQPDHIIIARLTPAQGLALINAIRNGRTLRAGGVRNDYVAISLSGSAAALLFLDDQQHRVGTATALQRPGPRPASSIPAPPIVPIVRLAPVASQTGLPTRPPATVVARGADCEDPEADLPPRIARLAPGLMFYGLVCRFDPRSPSFRLFLADESGGNIRAVEPPNAPAIGEEYGGVLDTVDNAAYDPATRTLRSVGYEDESFGCGVSYRWGWDGRAFQLLEVRIMEECKGVPEAEWPRIYFARLATPRAE